MGEAVDTNEIERLARDLCRDAGHDCEAQVRVQYGTDWLPSEIEFMEKASPISVFVRGGKVVTPQMLLEMPQWRTFRPSIYKSMRS